MSYVIDISGKYACAGLSKNKKDIIITNVFLKTLNKSQHKPIKMLVNQSSEFYNRSMKSWLDDNVIEMYSTQNKGKSGVAERNFKSKIYNHMTAVSKMCTLIS